MVKMQALILFLLMTCLPLGARAALSFSDVEAFLLNMKSETLPFPPPSRLYNHYYHTKKIEPTAVVFLPGMGESSLKYYDLARDLEAVPSTLYMWDHIGQGNSYHFIESDIAKVYIDSFETHLLALENFFSLLQKKHKTIYVVGHSMGAHLALRLALKHPDWIQKLALSAPMIELNRATVPIHYIAWLLDYLPGEDYPPFYSWFRGNKEAKSYLTQDLERLKVFDQIVAKYPKIKREGATIGWLRAALRSMNDLKKANPQTLTTPVLLLQAEKDYLVDNEAQKTLCVKLPRCETKTITGSFHEILFESDPARKQAVDSITTFLYPAQSPAKTPAEAARATEI